MENNKSVTAVEYLYKNLLDNPMSNEDVIYNISIFEKAIEMEKHQQEDIISETWIRCVGSDGNNFKETRDKIMEQFKSK